MQPHPRQGRPRLPAGSNNVHISSSNSTATRFFGGRQKAWMQDTNIVPPPPRPPITSGPYPTPPASTVDASPSQSSSSSPWTSTNPLPSNPVPASPSVHGHDASMPTESQSLATTASSSAPSPGVNAPAVQAGYSILSSGVSGDVHTRPVTTGANITAGGHNASSETTNGGQPVFQQQAFVPQDTDNGTLDSNLAFVVTDNQHAHHQHHHHHHHHRSGTHNRTAAPSPTKNRHQETPVRMGHPPCTRPPQAPVPSSTTATTTSNGENGRHHHYPPGPTMSSNGPGLQFRPMVATLETWLPGLPSTAFLRVHLLQQACRTEDVQFLSTHQVYALKSISSEPPQILSRLGASQHRGLDIVGNLLVPNSTLPPAFVSRCSKFPAPLEKLVQQHSGYRVALDHLSLSLDLFSKRWAPFETMILARQFPPLIDEMVLEFSVQSPVLFRVMFTACCRRLRGGRSDKWCERYDQIYLVNQNFYIQRWTETGCAYSEERRQTKGENDYLLRLYSELLAEQYNAGQTTLARPPGMVTSSILSQHAQQTPVTNQQTPRVQPVQSQRTPQYTTWRNYVPARSSGAVPSQQRWAIVPNNAPAPQQQPPPPPPPPQQQQQQIYSQQHPNSTFRPPNPSSNATTTPLLPPPGYVFPEQRIPNPLLTSLHEIHLMDSTQHLGQSGKETSAKPLYQFQCGFALRPRCLGDQASAFQWTVDVPPAFFQSLPKTLASSEPRPPAYGVVDGSKTFQLRCCRVNSAAEDISEEQWFEMDCTWPEAIYIHVNGTEHFVRRKAHNGKDLPTNITGSLRQGHNEMKLTFLRGPTEFTKTFYAVAVEMLDAATHDRVCGAIPQVPNSVALNHIGERLESSSTNDDELCIVDDHATIDLMDPFMACIFNVPVRSSACTHWECFDLDTYLSTRLARTVRGNGMAEAWKCPICGRDARPTRLFIDGFLAHVRAELEKQGQLDSTKAILVKKDRTWQPKVEGKSHHDSKSNTPSTSKAQGSSSAANATVLNTAATSSSSTATQIPPEIIELD